MEGWAMGVRIRERNGCWWVFVNHQNKRKAKKIGPGPEGARLAKQLADRLIVRLAYGEDVDGPRTTPLLKDYAEDWIRQIRITKKTSTAETYEGHMRRVWLPAFGTYALDRITRSMVKRWLVKLQASGRSRDYVMSILTPLQACFSEAVDEELIKGNPATRHGRALGPSTRKAKEIFTQAELDRLLDAALAHRPDSYVKLLILARTGIRMGEMLALQTADVDFTRQQILIRRTWGSRNTRNRAHCINMPKSGKWRWVDMSPQLAEVLRSYLAQLPAGSTWMFPGETKVLPMHPATLQVLWNKILAHADMPPRPPHSLRHTYVSMLIDRGENMLYVRDQLGHSSIRITMDVYGHMVPGTRQMGAAKLDSDTPICNPYATRDLRLVRGEPENPV
jgi:integrase